MKKIAIFASGSGTNAQNIYDYFSENKKAKIRVIITNKNDAYVLQRAKKMNIPSKYFNRTEFFESDLIVDFLNKNEIDLIVLAGFLWLIPQNILQKYKNRIINIHPALLPKYGGKGMFGHHVHQAVVDNNDTQSGITIHYVNEKYDDGEIIFQAFCDISKTDKADDIAKKVHKLEYEHYPKIIENILY